MKSGNTLPTLLQEPNAKRRLQAIACHVAGPAQTSDAEDIDIGFSRAMYQAVTPLSKDKHGGMGRQAWDDMRNGGQSRVLQGPHQIVRREAETGSSNLWRVHGKMYDLEKFLDLHPGGRAWLELTRGTDATQAFEAYHLDGPKVEGVLAKFYVRDVEAGEFAHGDRFTYEEDGFWRTLRRRVLAKLKSEAPPGTTTREVTSATPAMLAACTAVVAQFAGLHAIARSTSSVAGAAVAAALAGISQAGCWGVGHNFMHQAKNKSGLWPYAMDIVGNHSADWRISHCLSHHLDTNLETDWEYANFFPEYKNAGNVKGKSLPVIIPLMPFLTQLQSVAYIANSIREMYTGAAKTLAKHPGHLVPGVFPLVQLVSYIRGRGSAKKGVLLYCIQHLAFFMMFTPLAAGVHHSAPSPTSGESEELQAGEKPRNTLAWMEGQSGEQLDFGAHQVCSTTDHTVVPDYIPAFLRDWFSLTFFGYLNNHTIHHLFPGVDVSRLQSLTGLLEETAKEFGLDYKDVKSYSAKTVYSGWFRYNLSRQARPRL